MELTQEWVDALERYDVTIEEWERSPDSPLGAGEAGDLMERREAFVERIANEDEWRCVRRRSRASRAWVAVQSSGNRLVADDSIDPENCVSVATSISEG